jgi:DNA-binding beta-propeller fold protein YncE
VRPRADGSFWVVAFGSNEILRFDPNFKLLSSFKGGLEGFNRPYDIVEAGDGSLFISEYGANLITKCDSQGNRIKTFGGKGTANGLLLGPQYLAADSRGYIWVTDWGNSRVVRFDQDGAFIQAIAGIPGPTGIAAYEDRLYVSEKQDKRIAIYDLNGNFLSTIGEGALQDPEGLAFTPTGVLMVADNNRILACDLERETWTVQGNTSAHTKRLVQQGMSPNGDVLGVDFDSSKVVLLSDVTALYSGMVVRVDRVNAAQFPTVYADISVENRFGKPVVGLSLANFIVTENRGGVGSLTLALTNSAPRSIDVSMLVERSPDFEQYRSDAGEAIASLYAQVTQGGGRIKAISAEDSPVREADFGETRLRFVREALQGTPSAKWRFDQGAKMAGDELITGMTGAKRAIVFLTSGTLGQRAFTTYSVLEVAAFLRNNAVAFYPVVFGSKPVDENLAFLASETGGKLCNVASPEGMQGVVSDIKARLTPVYSIRYRSQTPPQFGDVYIPLEVEVTAQKVSGRDESGYYAPPTTGLPQQ